MGKRTLHKLSAVAVRNQKRPGLYGDGGGLHLRVTSSGAKGWIFRYMRRDMGLGGYPDVSLEAARERASQARQQLRAKVDPIEARRAEPGRKTRVTFAEACEQYLAAHSPGWRNPKHRQQWRNTLTAYAEPVIGGKDVREVTTEDMLRVLTPIWTEKAETASRLRGRIEGVLDWCAAKGYRDQGTINPATWRGNLKHLLFSPAEENRSAASPRPPMEGRARLFRRACAA